MDTNVSFMDALLLLMVLSSAVMPVVLSFKLYATRRDLVRTIVINSEMCENIKKLSEELVKTDAIVVDIIQHIERTDAIIGSITGDVMGVDPDGNVDRYDGPQVDDDE
jgi:hypothetical protein